MWGSNNCQFYYIEQTSSLTAKQHMSRTWMDKKTFHVPLPCSLFYLVALPLFLEMPSASTFTCKSFFNYFQIKKLLVHHRGPFLVISYKFIKCPGWRGIVDLMQACKPKCCRFNSQSRHMPGLWARSPAGGVQEATDGCFSPFLSPSLPFSLKISK